MILRTKLVVRTLLFSLNRMCSSRRREFLATDSSAKEMILIIGLPNSGKSRMFNNLEFDSHIVDELISGAADRVSSGGKEGRRTG